MSEKYKDQILYQILVFLFYYILHAIHINIHSKAEHLYVMTTKSPTKRLLSAKKTNFYLHNEHFYSFSQKKLSFIHILRQKGIIFAMWILKKQPTPAVCK